MRIYQLRSTYARSTYTSSLGRKRTTSFSVLYQGCWILRPCKLFCSCRMTMKYKNNGIGIVTFPSCVLSMVNASFFILLYAICFYSDCPQLLLLRGIIIGYTRVCESIFIDGARYIAPLH